MTARVFGIGGRTAAGRIAAALCVCLFSVGSAAAQLLWEGADGPFWQFNEDPSMATNARPPRGGSPAIGDRPEAGRSALKVGGVATVTTDGNQTLHIAAFLDNWFVDEKTVTVWRGHWVVSAGDSNRPPAILSQSGITTEKAGFQLDPIHGSDSMSGSNPLLQVAGFESNTAIHLSQVAANLAHDLDSRAAVALPWSNATILAPQSGAFLAAFSRRALMTNLGAIQDNSSPIARSGSMAPATGSALRLTGGFTNNATGGPDNVGQLLANSDIQFTLIPEPATPVLLGGGMFVLAGLRRRKLPRV
jgi:hypothetical protein